MTREELLSQLSKLLPSQFEQVLYLAKIPQEYLPAAAVAQASRAVEVMRYVDQQNQLEQLAWIVQQVVTGSGPPSTDTPSPPPVTQPSITSAVSTSTTGYPVNAQFEPLTTQLLSKQSQTKGASVPPSIWRIAAVPTGERECTKAQLHQAITMATPTTDCGTGRRAREPKVLHDEATERRREDGTQLRCIAYGGGSNERHEEQLGFKNDSSIWFQRAHFWDLPDRSVDLGQCAFDVMVFLKLLIGVGNALGVARYTVNLTLEVPRLNMVGTIQTHGFTAKQQMRTARSASMRHTGKVDVGPAISLPDSVQVGLIKQLVDGVANDFELGKDPLFGGGGAAFLEIDEASILFAMRVFK